MSIELITAYRTAVDERFQEESKRDLITNQEYSFVNAKTIKVYKIGTSEMNDYNRSGDSTGNWSRYGALKPLDAITETFTLKQDRSFTFVLDKMDVEETGDNVLNPASALARQTREVIIPEYDTYVYNVIAENAGNVSEPVKLTENNIYDKILEGSAILDEAMVPETERVIIISPTYYRFLKKSAEIAMATDVGQEMRLQGIVGIIDGMKVVKVPANRLPEDVGFMIVHKCATVAPVKLEDYIQHEDPMGFNGYVLEGRIYYDAFVLDNKKNAIYVQKIN